MVNRLVSVGDDFTLPAAVKAVDANLPAASKAAAIAAKLDKTEAATSYAGKSKPGYDEFQTMNAVALRPWYAALANRDYGPADAVFIGDSWTELFGVNAHGRQFVDKFRDRMRQKFPVTGIAGGYNYIHGYYTLTYPGDPVTYVGNPPKDNTFGWAFKGVLLTAGKSATFTTKITSGRVAYVQMAGQGTFSIAVDGGAATNVDANNATTNYFQTTQPASLTALDGNTHTVTVTGISGSTYVAGLIAYNGDETKGIRVWNGGHGGKLAQNFAASGGWAPALSVIQPSLVVIELGLNDQPTRTAAQYKADLLTIITKVREKTTKPPSILLLSAIKRGDIAPANTWDSYRQAMREIAAADPLVSFFDLAPRFTDAAAAAATYADYSLVSSDLLHPTDKGHSLIADFMVQLLSPR